MTGREDGINCIAGYIYLLFTCMVVQIMYANTFKYKTANPIIKKDLCCFKIFPYIAMCGLLTRVAKSISLAFNGLTASSSAWFDTSGYNIALTGHMMLIGLFCYRMMKIKVMKRVVRLINLSLLLARMIVSFADSATNEEGESNLTATTVATYITHIIALTWLTSLWIFARIRAKDEEVKKSAVKFIALTGTSLCLYTFTKLYRCFSNTEAWFPTINSIDFGIIALIPALLFKLLLEIKDFEVTDSEEVNTKEPLIEAEKQISV